MAEKSQSRIPVDSQIEDQTKHFYDTVGWVSTDQGVTGEDKFFRDFGPEFSEYGAKIDAKPVELLNRPGETLLLAGPGDVPDSHLRAAGHFSKTVCVDISERSIEICRNALGDKGEYHQASLLSLPLEDACVDAVLCTHVIYHIDKIHQQQAISELLRVTKPGGRIIIIYGNPYAPFMMIQLMLKKIGVNRLLGKNKLYTHYFPLSWWRQFSEIGDVEFLPNAAISNNQAKALLPFRFMQRGFYRWAMKFEDTHSNLAVKLWPYVTVKIDRAG